MVEHSCFLVENWIRSRVSLLPGLSLLRLLVLILFIVSFVMTRNAFFCLFFFSSLVLTGSVLGGLDSFYRFICGFLG
jgi:hypothetical protein